MSPRVLLHLRIHIACCSLFAKCLPCHILLMILLCRLFSGPRHTSPVRKKARSPDPASSPPILSRSPTPEPPPYCPSPRSSSELRQNISKSSRESNVVSSSTSSRRKLSEKEVSEKSKMNDVDDDEFDLESDDDSIYVPSPKLPSVRFCFLFYFSSSELNTA